MAKSKKTTRVTERDKLHAEREAEQPTRGATADTFDPLALPGEDRFPEAQARPRDPEAPIPGVPLSEQPAHVVGSLEHLRAEQAKYLAAPHTALEKTRPPQTVEEVAEQLRATLAGLTDDDTLQAVCELAAGSVMAERRRCAELVDMVGQRIEVYADYNSAQGCAAAASRFILAGYAPDEAPTNDA